MATVRFERMPAIASDHRRPGGTLYRYMMREMVFPTAFALGGMTLVVLTADVLGYTDLIINRGLGAGLVGWIAFYQTVPLAAEMLPSAVLVGSLVALGRMGADLELLSLEASGIDARRLLGPLVVFATLMAAGGFALSLVGAPGAARALDSILLEVSGQFPGALVRAGVPQEFDDWRVEAREVSADGRRLRGIALYIPSVGETIFAERGELRPKRGGATELALENGRLLPNPRVEPRLVRFDSMVTRLPGASRKAFERKGNELAGLHLEELRATLRDPKADWSEVRPARTELHRRFALPAAILVFGVLALPLFLRRAHFSRGAGAVLGLVAMAVYYGLVQVGSGGIQAGLLNVAEGVWLPNLVLLVVALLLLRGGGISAVGRREGRPAGPRVPARLAARVRRARRERRERRARAAEAAAREEEPAPPRVHRFALQRYVAKRFVQVALLCFALLVLAYVVVDVLERLQQFARYHATLGEVLRFYSARVLVLASRVVAMALLVATALTVALLAVQGELTGIRCCGIPAPRALLPILFTCALIVPASFFYNNNVASRAEATADYVKDTQIKETPREEKRKAAKAARAEDAAEAGEEAEAGEQREAPPRALGAWFRVGNNFYEAARFDPQIGVALDITSYELGPDGLPVSRADARRARHIGGGVWRLLDPLRVELAGDGVRSVPVKPFAELGEEVPAEVDTKHLSVAEILREIDEVESAGYDATAYRVDFVAKIATPFACLVLPALALFFCVSGPPFPSSATSLILSAAVAIAYTLATGIGVSLGYGGALPPVVAGSISTALFALLAIYFGLRLGGFGRRT
jgi:lipopolysaccharide export LptBFGC system permease protein LptF